METNEFLKLNHQPALNALEQQMRYYGYNGFGIEVLWTTESIAKNIQGFMWYTLNGDPNIREKFLPVAVTNYSIGSKTGDYDDSAELFINYGSKRGFYLERIWLRRLFSSQPRKWTELKIIFKGSRLPAFDHLKRLLHVADLKREKHDQSEVSRTYVYSGNRLWPGSNKVGL